MQSFPPTVHELVPLNLAAAVVFRRVYEDRTLLSGGRSTAHLDGMAYVMTSLVPVFRYEPNGALVGQIQPDELAGGLFRDGGKALYFVDGRAEIALMGVRASDIDYVVTSLIRQFPLEEEAGPTRGQSA